MEYLFTFLFCFITVYLVYSLVVVYRKKGFNKFKNSKQMLYFEKAYNIDKEKINLKYIILILMGYLLKSLKIQ